MANLRLRGTTALVTGASTGIGREIAKAIAEHGCRVGLVARSIDGLRRTQETIRSSGGQAELFPADLADMHAIHRLGQEVLKRWTDVDMLVNVAGVWHGRNNAYADTPLTDTPPDQINEVLNVGIRAPFLLTRLFLPGMMRKKSGKILQISGWFSGREDAVGWLHYYVSKKALEQFTFGLAEEVRPYEIQVNCISPGLVDTDAARRFYSDQMQRALNPAEVAKTALYLLSEDANHITGSCTVVRSANDH